MPEFLLDGKYTPAFQQLDEFTQGYVEALFFTEEESLGEDYATQGVEPLGEGSRYRPGFMDLAPEALGTIVKDCLTFQRENATLLEQAYERDGYTEARAGHDFWLTRNGHGAGYWDREELEDEGLTEEEDTLGDKLTEAAEKVGEVSAYLGDDGKVWL